MIDSPSFYAEEKIKNRTKISLNDMYQHNIFTGNIKLSKRNSKIKKNNHWIFHHESFFSRTWHIRTNFLDVTLRRFHGNSEVCLSYFIPERHP